MFLKIELSGYPNYKRYYAYLFGYVSQFSYQ